MRRQPIRPLTGYFVRSLLVASLVVLAAGCGHMPEATIPTPIPEYTKDEPPPVLHMDGGDTAAVAVPDTVWLEVYASQVAADQFATVSSGRFQLQFQPGSLARDTAVTISVRDDKALDVELGPHGIVFVAPVLLSFDYSGTNADPLSPVFDGSVPVCFWYNDVTGKWLVVPGVDDPVNRIYRCKLQHFSRYAVGGKAGW